MTIDIGTNFDWSESLYKKKWDVTIDVTFWVDKIHAEHDSAVKDQAQAVDNLVIPTQRNGDEYDVEKMSDEQKVIVYNAVNTVIKLLNNDPTYK